MCYVILKYISYIRLESFQVQTFWHYEKKNLNFKDKHTTLKFSVFYYFIKKYLHIF